MIVSHCHDSEVEATCNEMPMLKIGICNSVRLCFMRWFSARPSVNTESFLSSISPTHLFQSFALLPRQLSISHHLNCILQVKSRGKIFKLYKYA